MIKRSLICKKTISLLCFGAMTAGMLTGCGSSKKSIATVESNAPVKLTIMLSYAGEVPAATSPVLTAIDKLCNADIQIQWTPSISYNDKFNILMASNQLPDALIVPDTKLTTYVDGTRSGMFWDLTSELKKYSNLKTINPLFIKNVSTDGKVYAIPRERAIKRDMLDYRADWIKKAGLNPPDSLANIYADAKAFANGDFDGNGKKDTIGLALGMVNGDISQLNDLVVANGGFNGWGIKDGKVTPAFMTKEYTDTITLLRKMYAEKLISPDFAITQATQLPGLVDQQEAGMFLSESPAFMTDPLLKQMQQKTPTLKRSDVYGFAFLKNSAGQEKVPATSGIAGGVAFPKTTVKSAARLKELLTVYNKISSKAVEILMNNGIEGKDYVNGTNGYVTVPDPTLATKDVSSLNQLGTGGQYVLQTSNDDLDSKLIPARKDIGGDILVSDVTVPLLSETYTNNKANLDKIIQQAQLEYIMGKSTMDQFNQAVSNWRQSGGDKVIAEYTMAYNKNKK